MMRTRRTERRDVRWWLPRILLPCITVLCIAAVARADDDNAEPAPAGSTAVSTAVENDAPVAAEAPAANAPEASELLRTMDGLFESTGTTARAEIVIVTPKKTRTMQMKFWSKGEEHALMVIEAPPRDAGTATLRVEQNLWNYLPKISRTIRVPPSMMMGAWMGSDLTNDDIVKDSSLEDDYDSELVGRSEDPSGWLVRLTAKPDLVGLWSRIEVVFNDETGLPLLSRSYDRKERLSRTMYFEDVRTMGGRLVPSVMRIVPEREEGRSTTFRYLDVEFNVDLPDDTFSLARLERAH